MPLRHPLLKARRSQYLVYALALMVLVAALGCREDATSPGASIGPDFAVVGTAPPFSQISAGNVHSCGVAMDGRAYCWGLNSFGELGDGTAATRDAPVAVSGGLRFVQVRAGTTHTCGLTTDSLAYCWGQNDLGQLGNGKAPTGNVTPVGVAGGRRFTQILVGFRHTCAVTSAGVAFCWGENAHGQLGTGSKTGPQVCLGVACAIRPVRVTGGHVFLRIRPGGEHTCGLDVNYRYLCWGNNVFGQLGDGTRTTRLKPVLVVGGLTFVQVSAGGMHTCGVTSAHLAYCWGRNETGQLGDGSTTRRLLPVKVAGRPSVRRRERWRRAQLRCDRPQASLLLGKRCVRSARRWSHDEPARADRGERRPLLGRGCRGMATHLRSGLDGQSLLLGPERGRRRDRPAARDADASRSTNVTAGQSRRSTI